LTSLSPAEPLDTSLDGRFQLLIEAVSDYGIFVLDADGHVISWNTGAERMKGYTREEIIGKHFSIFYPPGPIATGWPDEELRRARKLGRFEDEGWRVRKDGTRFWANVVITCVYDANGVPNGFVKITRDLTERRNHEEDLRESEERFRLLVETVRDHAIFMLDPDGIVRSWNPGAQALKGYAGSEIIGRHFSTFYTPQDQRDGKPGAELRAARANGRVEDEGWRVRKDGTVFWANVVITAIHGRGGELIGFAKVTRDMTERRQLEKLEHSSRTMSQFLAMLAHELRNPLAPMRNAVTVMQLETLSSPALRNCRDIIDRQLTQVTRLVDDLLDIGRLTTGKIKLRSEVLRLAEIVGRSVETARPVIDARHHQLEVDLPDEPIYANGDSTRMSQIIQNLLVNAAKYTPENGQIRLKLDRDDGFTRLTISDNGRGIASDDLERIFDLFAQGANGRPDESGLGVGLTLARSLAEMQGGTLDAQSPGLGKGSTFTLRLPAVNMPPAAESAGTNGHATDAVRLLVVDDNRDSADTATAVLRMLGHEVECAYGGQEAIETATRFRPSVVLLDLAMPGMDGFETLRRLRANPATAGVYAVAMTGFGTQDDRQRTTSGGFDGHLTKPVELEALIALLDQRKTASKANAAS
jgi:PAS domain S-box-containing protein